MGWNNIGQPVTSNPTMMSGGKGGGGQMPQQGFNPGMQQQMPQQQYNAAQATANNIPVLNFNPNLDSDQIMTAQPMGNGGKSGGMGGQMPNLMTNGYQPLAAVQRPTSGMIPGNQFQTRPM